MNFSRRNKSQSGFAILESLLILIIIGAVIGIGSYVIKQRNENKASGTVNSASSKIETNSASKETIAPISTASKLTAVSTANTDITKLISTESDTEISLDQSFDNETLTDITDSNKAASSVGDSFNENDL